MAVNIKLKRSAVPGNTPTTTQLELGELALNTYDGKAFFKQQIGATETIVTLATTAGSGSSVVSASYALNASNANTASYATNAGSANNATSASYSNNSTSASYSSYADDASTANIANYANNAGNADTATSASYSSTSTSASYATNATSASYALNATTASYAPSALSASYSSTSTSASYSSTSTSASYSSTSTSASYALDATTASYSLTSSYADSFTVAGTLTAQKIIVQTITSSTEYVSGSTQFGSQLSNTHQFTGSVSITGSLAVNGVDYISLSSSLDSRILNNSGSISLLSSSFISFSSSYNTGSFSGSFTGSLSNLQGSPTHIPFFSASQILANSAMFQVDNGLEQGYSIAINEDGVSTEAPEALYVFQPSTSSYNVISGKGNLNSYLQLNIQNLNAGITASSDVVATANNGTETTNYVDMGINGENFVHQPGYSVGYANDSYLLSVANDHWIGSSTEGKITIFTGPNFDGEAHAKLILNPNNQHQMSGSLSISGSLTVLSGITGSLFGTSSWAITSSYALSGLSSSYALNATSASYALSGNGIFSGSFSGSFQGNGSGLTNIPASGIVGLNLSQIASGSVTASVSPVGGFRVNANSTIIGSGSSVLNVSGTLGTLLQVNDTNSGSLLSVVTGSTTIFQVLSSGLVITSGSNISTNGYTGSLLGTASYASNANTASYSLSSTSASYAVNSTSASYALNSTSASYSLNSTSASYSDNSTSASYTLSASYAATASSADDFLVRGTLTAQKIVVQTITSSIDFVTGSTRFGTTIDNTHQFTGSVSISGSLAINGSDYATTSASIDNKINIISSSYATTGSNTFVGNQTVTGSLSTSGSNTLVGSTTLTGSLNVSGSTTQIGNNTLSGNTTLSGSIIISGSSTPGSPTASVQIYGDIRQTGYHRFDPVTTNIDTSISASYIYVSGSTNDLYFSQNGSGYNNVTRLRWLEGNLYTGLLNGGLITAATGSTTYYISSGSGIIVNLNASLTDNPYPIIQYLNWGNLTGSISAFTSSYQQVFVGIDSTNNIYAQGTPFSNGQFDNVINIGGVFFQNGSTINAVKTQPSVAYGFEQQQNVFNRAFGPLKLSGYTLAPSGSSIGGLIVGSGTAYAPGSNYAIDPNEPSYTVDSGTSVSKIFRYRQSGSSWVYDTNGGAGYTAIDPANYSNNGVLTAVPGGGSNRQWSIQRVFWFPNSVVKAIVVYYGNATYATEVEAIANISFESFVEAPNTAANAVYLGAIIVRNDADFTDSDTYKIQPGGLFRQVGGSGGGGSVVTQTLSGLSDVAISGQTSGQALVWDSTAAKWENKSFISASISGNAATATTASYASTASYVLNAISASHASNSDTASYVLNAVSASYSLNSTSASYSLNSTSASYAFNATSASYALSSSFASTGDGIFSGSFSGSFQGNGSGLTNIPAGGIVGLNLSQIASGSVTASVSPAFGFRVNANSTIIGSGSTVLNVSGSTGTLLQVNDTISGSLLSVVTGSTTIFQVFSNNLVVTSGSNISTGGYTGSLFGTASYASNANSSSYALNSTSASYAVNSTSASYTLSASYAATSSYADSFTVAGTLTAQTIIVQTITSSVEYVTGSTQFGSQLSNTHQFTGSVSITGSLAVDDSDVILTNQTSSMSVATASYVVNAQTASYVENAQTASYVLNAVSSSYVLNAISASYALSTTSASYALNSTNAVNASSGSNFVVTNTLALKNTLSDAATVASSVVGSNNVFTRATGSYTSAFFKYTVSNGSNARSGEVMAVWNGTSVQYTDFSTLDIGSTRNNVTASVSIVSSDVQFNIQTNTSGWSIKSLVTFI
jgi:hypothetical protein